jgi:hypothetical protein
VTNKSCSEAVKFFNKNDIKEVLFMTEMLIEYDASNKTVKKVLDVMISSGVVRKKLTAKEKRIEEFKQAMKTKEMAENIAA